MRHLFEFERRHQPLASPERFGSRLGRTAFWAVAVIGLWEMAGMAGYMGFESMSAVDAFLNAAMILSGMGPLDKLSTAGGYYFEGIYALVCGLVFFAVAGLVLAPMLHRLLHRFHLEDTADDSGTKPGAPDDQIGTM